MWGGGRLFFNPRSTAQLLFSMEKGRGEAPAFLPTLGQGSSTITGEGEAENGRPELLTELLTETAQIPVSAPPPWRAAWASRVGGGSVDVRLEGGAC